MPGPAHIIEQAMRLVGSDPLLCGLGAAEQDRLRKIIGEAIASENESCMVALWNATQGHEREAMTNRFAQIQHLAHRDSYGNPLPSHLNTRFWTRWYPGLENDDRMVGDVLDTLPGFAADDVPAIVRAFENPASPLKLPGACTLAQHDVLHILLGRGLVDQDEAFVIGFTAGADPTFSDQDTARYKYAFGMYPEPYCIRGQDLVAFDLGLEAAHSMPVQDLCRMDVAAARQQSIGEVRRQFGIVKSVLYGIYATEQQKIPGTPWSNRLPRQPTRIVG